MIIFEIYALGMFISIILLCIERIFVDKGKVSLKDLWDACYVSIYWFVLIPWILKDILIVPVLKKIRKKL